LPRNAFEEELKKFMKSNGYHLKTRVICDIVGDNDGGHFLVDVRGEPNDGIKELFYFHGGDEPLIQRKLNKYFKSL